MSGIDNRFVGQGKQPGADGVLQFGIVASVEVGAPHASGSKQRVTDKAKRMLGTVKRHAAR